MNHHHIHCLQSSSMSFWSMMILFVKNTQLKTLWQLTFADVMQPIGPTTVLKTSLNRRTELQRLQQRWMNLIIWLQSVLLLVKTTWGASSLEVCRCPCAGKCRHHLTTLFYASNNHVLKWPCKAMRQASCCIYFEGLLSDF